MKYLIKKVIEVTLECMFHADDFGLNSACSKAILKALEEGRLQSLSHMPTGQDQAHNKVLLNYPHVKISVHLNLLEGRALTAGGHEFGITTKDGFFHLSLFKLFYLASTGFKKDKCHEWIFNEFCAQIEAVRAMFPNKKIRLDGHLHIHILPPLRGVLIRLIQKYDVEYVRTPIEISYSFQGSTKDKLKGALRRQLLARWARPVAKILENKDINTANYFIGATASCTMNKNHLSNALDAIEKKTLHPSGLVEIMMHPVINEPEHSDFYKDSLYRTAHITKDRLAEMDFLLSDDLKTVLDKANAVMVN